jgi:Ferritin-like domain
VPVGPSRRAVLAASAAAAGALVTGCRGVQALGTPPPPSPDVRLLRAAIAAEQLLIARYRVALKQAAGQGGHAAGLGLTAIAAEHAAHLAQLSARLVIPAGSALAREPKPSVGPAALPSGQLFAALAADEEAAVARLGGQLLTAPGSLAQLLASIAASEATHVPVLHALGRPA